MKFLPRTPSSAFATMRADASADTAVALEARADAEAFEEIVQERRRAGQRHVEHAGEHRRRDRRSPPIARCSTMPSVNEQAMPCGSPVVDRHVVRDRMGQGGARVGEGEPGRQRGERHAAAQLDVARVLHQRRQGREDQPRGVHGMVVGDRIGVDVPDRLERMPRGHRGRRPASGRRAGRASVPGRRSPPRGHVSGRCSEYFLPAARCQTVAQPVTSLPVPDVVGTAISVLARCGLKGLPVASRATSASNSPLFGADHERLGGVERAAAAADGDDHVALGLVAPEGAVHGVEAVDIGVRLGLVDDADQRRADPWPAAAAAGRSPPPRGTSRCWPCGHAAPPARSRARRCRSARRRGCGTASASRLAPVRWPVRPRG